MSGIPLRTVSVCLLLTCILPTGAFALLSNFDPAGVEHEAMADGRQSEQPTIIAFELNGDRIRMDGRLEDAAWRSASAGRGLV